jgi:hypothetical protein
MLDLCLKHQFKHCSTEMPSGRSFANLLTFLGVHVVAGAGRPVAAGRSRALPLLLHSRSVARKTRQLARQIIYLSALPCSNLFLGSSPNCLPACSLACSMDHENFSLLRQHKAQGTSRISPCEVATGSYKSSPARTPAPARCNRR